VIAFSDWAAQIRAVFGTRRPTFGQEKGVPFDVLWGQFAWTVGVEITENPRKRP
jgi:hypothetical protein